MDRIYEVDAAGYLHEEESEDVMDLDHTEVLSLLDVNHEMLPRDEGVGFEDYMNQRLDVLDAIEQAEIDQLLDEAGL